jgi:hypothetical protein
MSSALSRGTVFISPVDTTASALTAKGMSSVMGIIEVEITKDTVESH